MRASTCCRGAVALALLGLLTAGAGCVPPAEQPVRQPADSELATGAPAPGRATERMTFAIIGDYGSGDENARAVAELVASWDPEFVLSTGDGYYASAGGSGMARYDRSTGSFYRRWLKDVPLSGAGSSGGEAAENAFFPALGNHDYSDATPSPETYLEYFTLPGAGFTSTSGNERYYDFVEGDVHFFVLNSNPDEPDGVHADSEQAGWLRDGLEESTSRFNVVCDHHPPYCSDGVRGSTAAMRWPFAEWGADVIVSGHAHVYERVERDGITYIVIVLGGAPRYEFEDRPVRGSEVRYRDGWGAQRVTVTTDAMVFEFFDVDGRLIDRVHVTGSPQ